MKTLISSIACCLLGSELASAAVTLVEVDFSETGSSAVGTIAATNGQFTVKDGAIDFISSSLVSVGGGAGTAAWVYDGTGTAAANTDLHTGSTFGNPTRFDLQIGLATVGQTYTITSAEVDIRASNSTGTIFEFGYRDVDGVATNLVGSESIATQTGANPITTYTIDLTGEGLTATDSSSVWKLDGNGKLRFLFYQATATGNDNFQVDAIRLVGTSVPEPGSVMMFGAALLCGAWRRRR